MVEGTNKAAAESAVARDRSVTIAGLERRAKDASPNEETGQLEKR